MGREHNSHGMEGQCQRSRLGLVLNAAGGTSILNRGQFYSLGACQTHALQTVKQNRKTHTVKHSNNKK